MSALSTLRNLFLGVTLLMVALSGCKEASEPESSGEPAAVRKSITAATETLAPEPKPSEEKAEGAPAAEPGTAPEAKTPPQQVSETKTVPGPTEEKRFRVPIPSPQPKPETAPEMAAKEPEQEVLETGAVAKPPLPAAEVEPPLAEQKPPTAPAGAVEPMLPRAIGKKTEYFYDPRGKSDPFKPLFQIEAERLAEARAKRKKETRVPTTPLQMIALSQLKLVGVILAPDQNRAMVEDPTGKAYIITKGIYIGQEFGRVKQILIDRVIVEEEVEDFVTGEVTPRTTELKLQKRVGDE